MIIKYYDVKCLNHVLVHRCLSEVAVRYLIPDALSHGNTYWPQRHTKQQRIEVKQGD